MPSTQVGSAPTWAALQRPDRPVKARTRLRGSRRSPTMVRAAASFTTDAPSNGSERRRYRIRGKGTMNAGTRKVWFITGAGRGMGADFARAVLAAGHALMATGRDTERLSKALGSSKLLLTVKLDVTSRADAETAVRAAAERFGRIDVLVNNAASFYA